MKKPFIPFIRNVPNKFYLPPHPFHPPVASFPIPSNNSSIPPINCVSTSTAASSNFVPMLDSKFFPSFSKSTKFASHEFNSEATFFGLSEPPRLMDSEKNVKNSINRMTMAMHVLRDSVTFRRGMVISLGRL